LLTVEPAAVSVYEKRITWFPFLFLSFWPSPAPAH